MSDAPDDGAAAPRVAEVVVGLPVPRTFSYAIPDSLVGRVAPGHRVRVPFQGRPRAGVVVGLTGAAAAGLEPLAVLLDPVPALSAPLLELTAWAAGETLSAWGETIARALPPPVRCPAPASLPPAPLGRPSTAGGLVVGYGGGRSRLVEAAVGRAREAGRGVLLLAPEIETARGWATRLGERRAEPVALVTSAERPRRRWEAWWSGRSGTVAIVVGTRAGAFVPVPALGLTVVVDEHDAAHKAPDAPRWHARELAVERSRLEGGDCLLVSGAPSLESWARLRSGEATAEEVKVDHWPAVHRVDLRATPADSSLSPGLGDALRAVGAGGRRALLVVNRLGYGWGLGCAECGAVRRCSGCRIALTYHRGDRSLVCRLCGLRLRAASQCGRCRGRRLAPLGLGTERVEDDVRRAVPGVRVARYDGDLTDAQSAAVREGFRDRRIQVVVGTHMALRLLADGPVDLTALVLADATLSLPDFRAAERTFQLAWHLAEGVAAGGSAWIQSYYPEHPALEAVALGAREAFYEREWAERRELGYPPARRMARLLAAGREAPSVVGRLAEQCRAEGLTVLGPATLAGGRAEIAVLGDAGMVAALARVLAPLRGRRRLATTRLAVDVDPVELA